VSAVAPAADAAPTCDEALANAARLLRAAEMTTDQALMARLDDLASTWLGIAGLQETRER